MSTDLECGRLEDTLETVTRLHYQTVSPCPGIISIDQVIPQLVMAFITSIHFHHLTTSNVPRDVLQPGY